MRDEELLRVFVRDTIQELHLDPKMKAVIAGRAGHRKMQDMSRAKGLALRWSLERGIDLTPEMEQMARSAFVAYIKRYGRTVAPHALVQLLDMKYNSGHVGDEPDVPAGGGGGETPRPKRADDPEDARAVLKDRAL